MKDQEIFWLDDKGEFMLGPNNWKRPVTHPSFFLEQKLEWMDLNQIDHEVVLNLSQLYCNGMPEQTAADVLAFQNDFNAGVQADHPTKFTTGFVVQPAHIDQALKEMLRCKNELGLNLLCLPTHFLTKNEEWTDIADDSAFPIWELANELGLAVEIHPYDGPRFISLANRSWRFHLIWMCAQTADAHHFFALKNFPEKYPNIRTCFAHGNQVGQTVVGRRATGFEGRPDLFEGGVHPRINIRATNVFCDTLVHDIHTFNLLVQRQGVNQIVAGLDDPYPLGEMENVPGHYPGKIIEEALIAGVINLDECGAIWHQNVVRWLYGKNQNEFYKRTGIQPHEPT